MKTTPVRKTLIAAAVALTLVAGCDTVAAPSPEEVELNTRWSGMTKNGQHMMCVLFEEAPAIMSEELVKVHADDNLADVGITADEYVRFFRTQCERNPGV